MIFDKISNHHLYFKHQYFNKLFDYVINLKFKDQDEIIKYDENCRIKVFKCKTIFDSQIIESHEKEIDIQILIKGEESIKIFDSKSVSISKEYNESNDCQFYVATGENHSEIKLSPNFFAIFFPNDIHNPLIAVDNEDVLHKIVIKLNYNKYLDLINE